MSILLRRALILLLLAAFARQGQHAAFLGVMMTILFLGDEKLHLL